MPHGNGAGQLLQGSFVKDVGNQAHALVLMKVAALVPADYAGTFLPSVLLGVQSEIRQPGGILMAIDCKESAFVMNHSFPLLPDPVRLWLPVRALPGDRP